ncbi:hypothetical protein GCM10010172_06840 [Paractinoplanes ferrugineus]|uniref:Uncharacterized protein n=1 Tax=Paractinoplanes ferrugineus TaxID=113564 RepID=A0A919JAX0_9ACTN|nr:hypothetical protein [Actinoplanes ferrugineus]GIE16288.1 hypothetical protein Afe05nite_81280 [Actinoplanes ferrugineus]
MAYTTALTAVANASLTAAQWNASVRDNLAETAPAKATTAGSFFVATAANTIAERIPKAHTVGTTQNTTLTSYTNLATVGPTVTVTSGANALIMWGAQLYSGTTGQSIYMSYAISGATSVAATDASAVVSTNTLNYPIQMSRVVLQSTTAGSNVITCQYRVDGGTGNYGQRNLNVVPF